MLVLARKKNESIMIGDQIEIKVIAVEKDFVRIGISAPRDINVHRKEVYVAIQEENQLAVQTKVDWTQLAQWLGTEKKLEDE
ncbi:carbon storage regulator [Brevibacillus laterosporus]|uniref:Translational regulator CsrA n=1 Tax=Brevibacillus laterosporus LMG 15441 TaxID=1042163 RepID=A0A075RBM9_BRELA|nr:carbon storage regulator CsrA [Brevibacillus laterosporus]WPS87576.1 carbon storage regulator CsrA [Brevibacillus halotolerans]AIG28638.1 carbon storage regulator CsrA [Brevibacillus laterosporus LMG 15441]ERM17111.1 carbon storage regulator [Brevibacillus laterosporus PE36]MCR8997601.1 carbon storage regulator CsrA [Brevibacillus laterosporus]MDF9410154.1 carbon storage regulator [Brevibacillus laterosporus]